MVQVFFGLMVFADGRFLLLASGGGGTVTNVSTASILTGGPISTTGTISVNATITPQLRLTLTSGSPVMTSSVAASTNVYYTPYTEI